MDKRAIPFTQFLRPDGRQTSLTIERPADVAELAKAIIGRGYRFECEELVTGYVSLTVADDKGDHDIEVVPNGPEVPAAIDRMIRRFAAMRTEGRAS